MAQQEDNTKLENTENTIVMDQQINVARSELKNLRYIKGVKVKVHNFQKCLNAAYFIITILL